MTTKTKRSKDAARTPKSKPATPESAASARLRKEARAAVAANLAELERADPAPGSHAEPLGHNEQGGEPKEPQPDQQEQDQAREPATPAPAGGPGSAPAAKPAKAAKKGSEKSSAAKPKAEKAPKPVKPKRLSCIDAAAMVIGKDPIGCRDLIAEMGVRKLWSSPNGKTPDASLYAAITREIAAKGADARFKKVDRGLFIAGPGATKRS